MPVFYRGPRVRITHRVIDVPQLCSQRFAIDELGWVEAAAELTASEQPAMRLLGASALASVFVTVPVVGGTSTLVTVVIVVISLAYAAACLRARPNVHYLLRAEWRGRVVTLLDTTDRGEFDRVCRALRRAAEYRDDTR